MPDETMSPETIRELAALDAALAGEPVEPDLADLAELTSLLREERPEPDPTFTRALDDRVKRGFPRGVKGARAVPRPRGTANFGPWLSRFRTPLALGSVAAAVVVAIVVGSTGPSDDFGSSSGGGGGSSAASKPAPSVKQSAEGAADDSIQEADRQAGGGASVAPAPPSGRGSPRSDSRTQRFVERSAQLTLGARPRDLDDVADGVVRVTDSVGGFVGSSNVTSGEEATFELRIPSDRLQRALSDLSRLAHVRERTQATEDITSSVVSARDRLDDARAERRSLLRRLELAATDEEAEAIRRRLDIVAGEINGLRGRLHSLRLRTDYAVVTVSLLAKDDGDGAGAGGGSFDDALHDAGDLLVGVAGVIVRVLAVALPLAVLALLGWLATRAFRRRQRESALA
jgi:Domain of unknown function (DUF4349)